eukprot:gene14195-20165_t
MAINMYKKNRMYDQMIRLVHQHRKDNITAAEKHFTDAKDWKAAVQMYRANAMWEDALRVAKIFGGVNASKQVAYAWAISLGGDEGAVLLKKLGLLDQAIDYAMESGAFAQAFELTRAGAKAKLPEVHLKYAMFLEDEGRFAEAEAEFIAADKPKEAVDMYIHTQDWDAGMRVAEQYDPASVSDVLIAQARSATERQQYQVAESMYLQAKRPELALKMYRDIRLWHDALRLAEDYLPSKVQEIHMEMAGELTGMVECWEQAASLAMKYQRHRVHDVINLVTQRLIDIQRYQAAAELHESIDDIQGAIRAYCLGGLFDNARQLGGTNPTFSSYIEEQYNSHLVQNKSADELATRGGAASQQAIDMYIQRDDWGKVHELASQQGSEVAGQYAVKHAERRFRQGEYGEAAIVFSENGISGNPQYFDLYRNIAIGILSAAHNERNTEGEKGLKGMLFKLLNVLGTSGTARKNDMEEFRKMYLAGLYISLANTAKADGMKDLAAKQLTAALRYAGIIPADRAFYEAGIAWRDAGRQNMAFVMLNRFLDLTDAMDDPDSSAAEIENSDFADTDIPFDFHIPQRAYTSEDQREEVRNYVLELSMDQQVEQVLTSRACDFCGGDTFESNLTCQLCKGKWEPCAVSGYPVSAHEKVVSKQNGFDVVAIRDNWNQWVTAFHTCPVTNGPATPMY